MKDSTNVRSKVAASGSSIFLFVVATIFAGAILFSTGTTATNVVATCAPVPANLVAWYRGENNANDFVGTNHGSLLNGATFAPGRVGQAFSFDGVDSMVNVPFTSALNVASAVTIEAWVKTNSTVTGDHKLLAGRPGNYQLAKLDDGRVAFAVVIGGNFINVFSTTTLAANTLTHVAGTYDAATGLVKIYVDGILTGTTVTAGIPDAGAQPFQIGGFGGTFVSNQFINNFGGAIDEVSLYNRALSASEIQSIFDANDAGKCVPCTPLPSNGVSWHRAENDANDSVGSNNGTLQNGAAFATGRVGQAFDLDDGTNAYVDIGNLAGLDNATGLTVMAWIKRQNAGNSDGAIVGKWRDRSTADNSFLLLLGGGGFAQNVGAFIIEFDNDTDGFLQDNTVIPFDTWTFVAATWRNSDGALKLYKNGIEKGSTTAGVGRTLRIHPAAFTAKIGEWGISPVSSTSPSFPGQIDEPAIFNRALTAAEILAIYDGDSAGMCLPVCTPPPSNLVSWYPGEGNANDQQGNNNGTLQNGATFAPGKVGQAFSFDGVNDSVDIANTTSLDFGAGNFSIEFWANLNSLSTDQMLFHKISGTGASFNDPSYFVEFDQPNALRFRIGEAFLSNSNDLIVPTSLTAGQWFHVAAVRNGDLTQIYLNGVLAGSQTSGSNINTGTGGNAAIGRCLTSDAGCARFVNGKIDEVSLYNRALSASEIQAIYDADSAGICLPTCTPPPSNLESWYRGEGDANDSQGTNHGTLVNGAGFATAVVNQGFNLDGVNDFVRVGNPPALRFGTGDFSIQAWVKTSFRGGTFNDYIISKSGVGNDAQFILSYNAGGTGLPSFLMSDGTTISSAIGTANLADGTFHHLAGVREGTTLRLYVDGVQVGTATTPSLVNATSANNVIIGGRDNPDFDPYFKGIIDEVQFLNRALSASEIQAIFNAGSAGTCSSTPLQISPTTQTVNIGGTVNFTATGGTPPYAFSLFSNNSLATIDPVSGVYTAGTLVSADTVRVTDALGATSDAIVNVSAAAPTRLAFIVQPMNATSGQSISPALQVAIQDNAGNTVTNATDPVTIALGTNTGGSTLSGNVTRDAVNGIATFDDLSLNRSGTGYELVASSGSLASATSIAFNVDPGTASQLVFTVQPSNAKRSAIITPAIQVEVRDANGNLVTNSATPVLLAIGNNPGGGTLQGSSVQQTINGVATFSDLRIVGGVGGHGYTLDATSTGSPQTTSNPFNIFGPTQLAFTVQPSNAKRSAIITPPIQVEVQDENGDVVTDSQHFIQLFPGNFPGFGSLQGVSGRQTINGVATFNDLRIVGGNGGHGYTLQAFVPIFPTVTSSPFNIFGPTQLAFTVQPSNARRSAIITPAVEVQVQDENGDVVTDSQHFIQLFPGNFPGFGSLQGVSGRQTINGVATFNDLRIVGGNGGHGYTLQAFVPIFPTVTSSPFNIFGPTQLAFTVQPSNARRSAIITPAVEVQVQDENGDVVTDSQHFIQLFPGNFPGFGSLQGISGRQTINGVATFNDLRIVGGNGGHGYTLLAFVPIFPTVTSSPFNIFGPTQLAFTVQPSNAKRSAIITPPIQVEVQDENGDLVTDSQYFIQLFPGNFPGFGSLQGISGRQTINGVATFNDLRIVGGVGGHGYTLQAFLANFPIVTSTPFNIFGPTQLAFTVQPSNTDWGAIITPAVQVQVQDENGAVVTDSVHFINLFPGTFPGGGSLQGLSAKQTINGVATFDDLRIVGGNGGHAYTLGAFSQGFPAISSNPFDISASPFTVTNTNDSGPGSLRQAILNANNTLNTTITFSIAGTAPFTITPLTSLPMVGPFITIDGTTQLGYTGSPIIELDGSSAGTNSRGLLLGEDVTVKGLTINRFARAGVELGGSNTVQGNYIGTDITGTFARPNGEGILINSGNNLIGGPNVAARNVISGNSQKGIKISGPNNGLNNVILGNYIGTNASGTAGVPNTIGISTSRRSIIGGTLAGEGNLIAYNSDRGVSIEAASGVSVRGNSIHSNGPIDIRVVNGIDINPTGLNTNDYCDNDTGANGRQNFPLLTTVNLVGIETRFGGILAGKPNTTYTIDFYSCVQCDRSGYGEANTYLGSGNVTTGGTCSTAGTPFSITVPGSINVDQPVVATATDEQGSTSEFSLCFAPAATIQGTVSGSFGEPIAGVLITLDREDTDPNPLPPDADFEFRTVTDQLGRFSLKNLPLGHNWRVTPIKQNFTFTPSSRAYPNLQTDHDDTYTGLFNFSSVRGKVTLNGLGLKDVTMTLTRGLLFSRVTTTSKSGNYSFPDVVWPLPGAFTVTPSRPGYVFTPASATFNLGTDDQIHDFSAATLESTLPGRILLKHGPDVFAMNADGSGSMTLLPGQHFGSDPLTYAEAVFSPAGDKIATASRDDSARLSIRNADGTAVSNIFSPSSVTALLGTSIGWSPDAGSLAFTQLVSSTQRIYRIGTNGNNLTQLTTGISMDTLSPDWSPDGSKLVFSRSGGWLYRMTTNGSNVTPLLVNGFPFNCAAVDGSATSPKWSPDGTKIAFHARCSNPMSRGIFTVDADGTNLTQVLVDNVNSMKDLDWAPGGVRLAFLRVRPPPSLSIELVSVLPDGSNPHVIDQVFDQWPYYPLDTKFDWGRDNSIPTPPGTSVNVQSGPISITYAATSGSNATTSINPINPASVGTTPGGFSIGNMAYEISTTANVTPPITVCFVVSPAAYPTQAAFSMLHILHGENGVLVPRTTFRHFPSRTICATVSSLSPFALGEQFDASLPSVSGLVLDPDGAALRDVTIALTGDEDRFTETDEEGYFRFTNLTPDGNYSVQPNSVGYLFNSPYQSYIGINGEETVVFTATAANFSIRGSVSDQDGNPLANVPITLDGTSDETTTDASGNYTLTGLPAHGSFSIVPLQSGLFFTPSQVSVQSLQNNVSEINFVSGPPPPNQSPNAANDVATTNQNTPISIVVLANDADSDGDVLTVTNTTQGSNGAVVINADNTVTYSPSAGFAGTDSFNYTISDGRGGSASATVNVTVSQVNRPPTVVVQNVTRNADANCQAVVTAQEVSGGSSDPDGDAITLTLTPAGPFGVGAHPVTVTVTDSHGASASANATVTVIDNTPPAITCPSSIVATAPPGQSSAVVNYSASATDNCSNVMVTATHPSGSTFPVGVTTVTVTATDAAGTTATCSFTVTINGSTAQPDKIAFDSTRDGNLEIYSMNADGTNQTRLTSNSALDFKPTWSPDRSKIAFTSSRTGNGDIYVMNADGTNQTRLTSNSAIEDDASWSPDGTKIAFWSNRDGNPEIYVMNANGSNQSRLTSNSAWDTQPKWSPDGTKLAFVSNRNGVLNFDIYVMNANGSQVTRLTTSSGIDESPDWSPAGSQVVFTSNRSNLLDFEIWVMNASGSGQSRLTTSTRSSVRPTWSRDGAQVTFATNRIALLNFEIYSMNADGTNQTRLTNNSALDFNPDR